VADRQPSGLLKSMAFHRGDSNSKLPLPPVAAEGLIPLSVSACGEIPVPIAASGVVPGAEDQMAEGR
jgi:hypothetical protein